MEKVFYDLAICHDLVCIVFEYAFVNLVSLSNGMMVPPYPTPLFIIQEDLQKLNHQYSQTKNGTEYFESTKQHIQNSIDDFLCPSSWVVPLMDMRIHPPYSVQDIRDLSNLFTKGIVMGNEICVSWLLQIEMNLGMNIHRQYMDFFCILADVGEPALVEHNTSFETHDSERLIGREL
jgi:hypothetical protein